MKLITGNELSQSDKGSEVTEVHWDSTRELAIDLPSYLASGYGWNLVAEPARLRIVSHIRRQADPAALGGGCERIVVSSLPGKPPGPIDVTLNLVSPRKKRPEKRLFFRIVD